MAPTKPLSGDTDLLLGSASVTASADEWLAQTLVVDIGAAHAAPMHAAFYSPANCDHGPTDAELQDITNWLARQ